MKHTRKLLVLAAGLVSGLGVATAGWAYWSAQGSGTATATVGTWKTDTTTAVASSGNPSIVGQSVTFTATVTASGSPTGKVEFFDGATPISGCGGAAGAALSGASATCVQAYSAAGTHSITAQYLGDASFNASPLSSAVAQVVNQVSTSTSLAVAGSPASYGNENAVVFTSNVSAASGTPTGTVAIKQGTATLCSITLPANTCSPSATALGASPTAYSITAVYSTDGSFLGSTSSAQNLTVNKGTPVISWDSPAGITYGTALSAAQLNATTNVLGTMVYSPAAGTVLAAGSHPLSVTFNPTDTSNYSSAEAGVATLTVDKAPLTITASNGTMTYGGTPPTIAPSYGGFVNGQTSTVLTVQPTCTTTATASSAAGSAQSSSCSGAAAANYTISYANGTVTVSKATQTITFTSTAPANPTVGGATYSLAASATSGLAVTFTSATPTVCTVSGSTATFVAAGSCTINANQTGNANWVAAPQVPQTFTVGKGSQAITFTSTPPSNATVGGPTHAVSATGGASGNPVTFSIDSTSTSVCSISGSTVSFTAVGACKVNANQAGNSNYQAASQAQQSFAVVSLTITSITSADNGGTPGKVEATDTFSVTFNNPLDPTKVATGSQTMTLCSKNACTPNISSTQTKIIIPGLTVAAGLTIDGNYVSGASSGSSATASGTLSLSTDRKTVTFTVTGIASGTMTTAASASTFGFTPLATIKDAYGNPATNSFNQATAIKLF